jgi:hypothetical protein
VSPFFTRRLMAMENSQIASPEPGELEGGVPGEAPDQNDMIDIGHGGLPSLIFLC